MFLNLSIKWINHISGNHFKSRTVLTIYRLLNLWAKRQHKICEKYPPRPRNYRTIYPFKLILSLNKVFDILNESWSPEKGSIMTPYHIYQLTCMILHILYLMFLFYSFYFYSAICVCVCVRACVIVCGRASVCVRKDRTSQTIQANRIWWLYRSTLVDVI